ASCNLTGLEQKRLGCPPSWHGSGPGPFLGVVSGDSIPPTELPLSPGAGLPQVPPSGSGLWCRCGPTPAAAPPDLFSPPALSPARVFFCPPEEATPARAGLSSPEQRAGPKDRLKSSRTSPDPPCGNPG